MSTTYKPALLKALVRIVAREALNRIPLTEIGAEFTKLYWNQTVVFHLRQAAVLTKEPEVIKAIRSTAERCNVRDLSQLPAVDRRKLEEKMARVLTIDVLRRFHNSKPEHMPPLFTWDQGDEHISLSKPALAFIEAENRPLETLANYWWAKYLERVNLLAPLIIDKVERNGARRGGIAKFLKVLQEVDDKRCFYCGRNLDAGTRIDIDHVLPWSFLLADPVWDLVLTCAACNSAKSDWLPDRKFIDRLITANETRHKKRLPVGISPAIDADEIYRLYDAAISLEWPRFWSPSA